jgi:hypothetical protein
MGLFSSVLHLRDIERDGPNDNDGPWRAVEVYACGELPKKREPDPVRPPTPPKPRPNPTPLPQADWWVNSLSVGGLSLVFEVGGGFADGTIGFENLTSRETITDRIRIGGVSVGASAGVGASLRQSAEHSMGTTARSSAACAPRGLRPKRDDAQAIARAFSIGRASVCRVL